MWDLPGPGLEPMSPALAGGFLTTAPPGKSHLSVLDLDVSRKIGRFDNPKCAWQQRARAKLGLFPPDGGVAAQLATVPSTP